MRYTVKDVSEMSQVTVKTLHHYHKIGLLPPCEISEAGYRLYSGRELERLQEILFYRELDFSLEEIQRLLDAEPERIAILRDQKERLLARAARLQRLVGTLELSLSHALSGERLAEAELFRGFATAEEWKEALEEQRQHVLEHYQHDMLDEQTASQLDPGFMNEQAREAKRFMDGMAAYLRSKTRADSPDTAALLSGHIAALNRHGHPTTADELAARCRFFLTDDFHRDMLESQQLGLAYYLCAAAEAYAKASSEV